MKSMKKVFAICAIGALALGMAGCSVNYNQEQVDKLILDAKSDANKAGYEAGIKQGIDSIDVDSVVAQAIKEYSEEVETKTTAVSDELDLTADELKVANEEVERLKTVLADYEEVEKAVLAETMSLEGSEEIEIGVGLPFTANTYDDGDIKKLLDTEIKFDGTNYDIHEEIITTTGLKVGYSLDDDEEFADSPYIMTTSKAALTYSYVFDDTNDFVKDATVTMANKIVTRDEPLTIDFLGKEMIITNVEPTEFEIRVGDTNWLRIDETLTVNDMAIKLESVTEDGDSAGLLINDEIHWIDEGDDLELDGITIAVEDVKVIHSDANAASVKLTFTTTDEVYQTFKDGDAVIYDADEDDSEFVYRIATDGATKLNSINVEHNQKMDELDDDFLPLKEGDSIVFPNDYFALTFDSTNVDKYNKVTMEFDDVESELGTFDGNGIVFKSDADDGFEVTTIGGTVDETDEVYMWTTNSGVAYKLAYLNDDNDVIDLTATTFDIVFEDIKYSVTYNTVNGIVIDSGTLLFDIGFDATTNEFVSLGTIEDAEANDIIFTDGVIAKSIGTSDNDVLGTDGVIVVDPESNADNDIVELLIPEKVVEVTAYLG